MNLGAHTASAWEHTPQQRDFKPWVELNPTMYPHTTGNPADAHQCLFAAARLILKPEGLDLRCCTDENDIGLGGGEVKRLCKLWTIWVQQLSLPSLWKQQHAFWWLLVIVWWDCISHCLLSTSGLKRFHSSSKHKCSQIVRFVNTEIHHLVTQSESLR